MTFEMKQKEVFIIQYLKKFNLQLGKLLGSGSVSSSYNTSNPKFIVKITKIHNEFAKWRMWLPHNNLPHMLYPIKDTLVIYPFGDNYYAFELYKKYYENEFTPVKTEIVYSWGPKDGESAVIDSLPSFVLDPINYDLLEYGYLYIDGKVDNYMRSGSGEHMIIDLGAVKPVYYIENGKLKIKKKWRKFLPKSHPEFEEISC